MLRKSLTLHLPHIAPQKLSEPDGFRSLPGKGCPSLERAAECWSTAVLVKPLSLCRGKHTACISSTARGQHPLHTHIFAVCKVRVCGQRCTVVPGISPLPEPPLHPPGPAGSHPALLLLQSLHWGCLYDSSAPFLLRSGGVKEVENKTFIPSHIAPNLENFRITQAFCLSGLPPPLAGSGRVDFSCATSKSVFLFILGSVFPGLQHGEQLGFCWCCKPPVWSGAAYNSAV